jgi:hypothetical protein
MRQKIENLEKSLTLRSEKRNFWKKFARFVIEKLTYNVKIWKIFENSDINNPFAKSW